MNSKWELQMTDFGGLALNIQHVQLQEVPVSRVAKTPKKNETYRNENFKVNPKLLQILKDNQQELSAEEQQQQQLAQMQNNNNGNGNEQQMEEEKNYRRVDINCFVCFDFVFPQMVRVEINSNTPFTFYRLLKRH